MLLTHKELVDLVETGLVDAPLESINASSIDVRLGESILVEAPDPKWRSSVDMNYGDSPQMLVVPLTGSPYALRSQSFALASTLETFNLPDNVTGFFCLRSTLARAGLQHSTSIGLKPGWQGNLTLELTNSLRNHSLILHARMVIGDVYFFKHEPVESGKLYQGRYQGISGVSGPIAAGREAGIYN
jgi:dCTP deaminase